MASANKVIIVSNYTEKSMAVFGECTREFKDELKKIAKYNPHLTLQEEKTPGWFFPKSKIDQIRELLASKGVSIEMSVRKGADLSKLKDDILKALQTHKAELNAFLVELREKGEINL